MGGLHLNFIAGNKAVKPCRCGFHGDASSDCYCTPQQIASYRGKICGPLRDRIDLRITVPRVAVDVLSASSSGESTANVRERVLAARALQDERGWLNVVFPTNELLERGGCESDAAALSKQATDKYVLSTRMQHKVLRVAWTVADLADSSRIGRVHVAEAISMSGAAAMAHA